MFTKTAAAAAAEEPTWQRHSADVLAARHHSDTTQPSVLSSATRGTVARSAAIKNNKM